jgi:putative ABC transport system permease protein
VVTITGGAFPERVQTQLVGGDYFTALGVTPAGRGFGRGDSSCELIVSRRFAGRALQVEGNWCEVVGVMPDGWIPPLSVSAKVDAWMPLAIDASEKQISILARLAPHATLDEAKRHAPRVSYLKEQVTGPKNRGLLALAGAVTFLLLIACLNITTLMRARATAQRREMAIRAALGATRGELARHLLGQAMALAATGGACGIVMAYASLDALVALAHNALPRLQEVRMDWRVLAFTAVLTVASGVLTGIGPAIGFSRASLRETLNTRSGRNFLRHSHMAAQIAIAFVLLTGAGLLIRSFQAIRAVDLGFRPDHVLAANFGLPPGRHGGPQQYVRFLDDVLARVRSVPGVVAATATVGVPLRGSASGKFEIYGRPAAEAPTVEFRPGDEGYFHTLGITVERGRAIGSRDVEGAEPVALVNQKLARELFGGEEPIGKRIRMEGRRWMMVVGVAHDTRHIGPLRDSLREVYLPYAQWTSMELQPRALVVRTAGSPERLVPDLQRAVASVDKDQPLVSIGTLEGALADFLAPQRFETALIAVFAAIGLALASIGIFGVMAYGVAQRTHEIGVRMAIGADRRSVFTMVVWDALRTAAVGLVFGWAGAWGLGRFLTSMLFGVTEHDPTALAVASLTSVAAALAASSGPARRASRVDPVVALRAE